MLTEKSVNDMGLGSLQTEGDSDTKFIWSVCLTFSHGQHHLNQCFSTHSLSLSPFCVCVCVCVFNITY